jgi:hypothetical protein
LEGPGLDANQAATAGVAQARKGGFKVCTVCTKTSTGIQILNSLYETNNLSLEVYRRQASS